MIPKLTARQAQVLQELADGWNCRETADRIGLAYETIRKHAKNAMLQLGCNTQAGAVAAAFRLGIIR